MSEEERSKLPEELQDEPLQSVAVTESNDVPITFMQFRYSFEEYFTICIVSQDFFYNMRVG